MLSNLFKLVKICALISDSQTSCCIIPIWLLNVLKNYIRNHHTYILCRIRFVYLLEIKFLTPHLFRPHINLSVNIHQISFFITAPSQIVALGQKITKTRPTLAIEAKRMPQTCPSQRKMCSLYKNERKSK